MTYLGINDVRIPAMILTVYERVVLYVSRLYVLAQAISCDVPA